MDSNLCLAGCGRFYGRPGTLGHLVRDLCLNFSSSFVTGEESKDMSDGFMGCGIAPSRQELPFVVYAS